MKKLALTLIAGAIALSTALPASAGWNYGKSKTCTIDAIFGFGNPLFVSGRGFVWKYGNTGVLGILGNYSWDIEAEAWWDLWVAPNGDFFIAFDTNGYISTNPPFGPLVNLRLYQGYWTPWGPKLLASCESGLQPIGGYIGSGYLDGGDPAAQAEAAKAAWLSTHEGAVQQSKPAQ
jgi:hypothetical protein